MLKVRLNTAAVLDSMRKHIEEHKRKTVVMVQKFAYHVAFVATSNTPLGDAQTYFKFYDMRKYWPKEEGMARANWQFSKDMSFPDVIASGRNTGADAVNKIQTQMLGYKIGDTFYIGNGLAYINILEQNKSPQTMGMGIMKPSLDAIVSVYGAKLNEYYNTA